jgi:hypothetical protein
VGTNFWNKMKEAFVENDIKGSFRAYFKVVCQENDQKSLIQDNWACFGHFKRLNDFFIFLSNFCLFFHFIRL